MDLGAKDGTRVAAHWVRYPLILTLYNPTPLLDGLRSENSPKWVSYGRPNPDRPKFKKPYYSKGKNSNKAESQKAESPKANRVQKCGNAFQTKFRFSGAVCCYYFYEP